MRSLFPLCWRWFTGAMFRGELESQIERPEKAQLPPIEKLESRLCLGSMHAGALADWAEPGFAQESLPAHVAEDYLEGRSRSEARPIAGEDDEGGSGDKRNQALPGEPPPSDVETRPHNLETSASLAAALDRSLSGSSPTMSAAFAEHNTNGIAKDPISTESVENAQPSRSIAASSESGESGRSVADGARQHSASAPADGLAASDVSTAPQSGHNWTDEALASLGLILDADGNAWGVVQSSGSQAGHPAWWTKAAEPVRIGYDFRDQQGAVNQITEDQKAVAVASLARWSQATGGQLEFFHDTESDAARIINIGVGDIGVFGHMSGEGGVLGLGGGITIQNEGQLTTSGVAWLDHAESWDNIAGNGDPSGTVDFATVVSHEIGHTLGLGDTASGNDNDIMDSRYRGERSLESIDYSVTHGYMYRGLEGDDSTPGYAMQAMTVASAQLADTEVEQLLARATRATSSNDAIIAVVDRNGRVLGVRVEAEVLANIPDTDTLVFAIDGAIAKARTAALFSNGNPQVGTLAPLTSRTVRFLSQSTVTQREVESNPNVDGADLATALASTTRGPGFVAPIGTGGHFPPDIDFTPPVDLFAIEHTNRDSTSHPGPDGIRGTADDITLRGRFNIDPAHVPAGNELFAPESYGHAQNSGLLPNAQSRGIATLPGGIPLFRDTNGDGVGETLVGGIGVFFPGTDGTATFEQGFLPNQPFDPDATRDRTNAPKVLEAEYIAFAAAGGSRLAEIECGIPGAEIGDIGGIAEVVDLDVPFGRLDLVGIQLEVLGPIAGPHGVRQILDVGMGLGVGADSGADQPLIGGTAGLYRDGLLAPGDDDPGGTFLVTPHGSADMTAAEVDQIIAQGILAANEVRAAVRLPLGSRTKMVLAVTDTQGEVLGVYRMQDATTFSIDVAIAKARNVAYYADSSILQPEDQVPGVTPGTAFTNRTFRFLAEPRYPSGIDGVIPEFSILNDGSIDPLTAENRAGPDTVAAFDSVLGHDAFFPMTNFRDPGDAGVVAAAGVDQSLANQNGIVFFPGSTPLYRNGVLIGGLGISGDGVDQDDVVTSVAATGFQAADNATRADEVHHLGVRLPFQKFLRNPWG